MKKRVVYIMMFLVALLLGGCNLFSGLDKEDLDAPGAFEAKIDDALASGNYVVAVELLEKKIATEYKDIDNSLGASLPTEETIVSSPSAIVTYVETLQTYLTSNISNPKVQEYVELKIDLAKANLGKSNIDILKIANQIKDSGGSGDINNSFARLNKVTASDTSVSRAISIKDISVDNINEEYLYAAITDYFGSLVITETEFDKYMKEDHSQAYLNAILSSAVSVIKRFESVYKDENGNIKTYTNVSDEAWTSDLKEWKKQMPFVKAELQFLIDLLTVAGVDLGVIDADDLNTLKTDSVELLLKVKVFDTIDDYNQFKTKAGY